jgi:hypothetical protein
MEASNEILIEAKEDVPLTEERNQSWRSSPLVQPDSWQAAWYQDEVV